MASQGLAGSAKIYGDQTEWDHYSLVKAVKYSLVKAVKAGKIALSKSGGPGS